MSLEFIWEKLHPRRQRIFQPIEVGSEFRTVLEDKKGRKKLISDGRIAFEIINRGRLYDRLLAEYEFAQRRQQAPKTVLQKAEEKPTPVAPVIEAIEQVAEVADIAPTIEQAETREADYKLSPDDWFECFVQRVSRNERTLILVLDNATATCVPAKITQSPGDHVGACLVGLTGAVRLEMVGGVYRALELQVLGEPTTLREEARVTWRDPALIICKAERPCGCRIFIGGMADEGVYGEVSTGDWIAFDLERSRTRGNWIGVRAKKISPEGQGVK